MMKNKIKILLFSLIIIGNNLSAQIYSYEQFTELTLTSGFNYFIEASSSQRQNGDIGKLLGFPRTDLTTFKFISIPTQGTTIVRTNFYDGAIVYNTSTGKTMEGQGKVVDVTPGFYYFYNPGIGTSGRSVVTGEWKKLVSTADEVSFGARYVEEQAIDTGSFLDSNSIKAYKGKFSIPTETTTKVIVRAVGKGVMVVRFTIFSAQNNFYTNTVYSYNPETGELITGAPNIAVSYNPGDYDYIIEYIPN